MLTTGLIVFREALEAALFIGVMAAATRGLAGRGRAIVVGIAGGVVGSVLVAGMMGQISAMADGAGSDWFNIVVLLSAFAMLLWHVVWAQRHGRELAGQAKRVGAQGSLWAIAVAIALMVLREGSETVLFISSALASNEPAPMLEALPQAVDYTANAAAVVAVPEIVAPVLSMSDVLLGGVAGLTSGVLVGLGLYWGLAKISVGRLFAVTNVFVVLLAAGMMGQVGRKLVQVDVLPSGLNPLWDSSSWIGADSGMGTFLHALLGYEAQPSVTHVLFFGFGFLLMILAERLAAYFKD
ncbi:MAG: FTR1 family iron permease [Formosimonas sp.]